MAHQTTIAELQHLVATHSDQRAYTELFNQFAPALIRFCNSWVADEQVAEEIVSDVFIRIWQRRETLDQIENLKLYLYISVRNFAINYLKSKKKQAAFLLDEIAEKCEPTDAQTPYHILVFNQLKSEIQREIELLPPQCSLIFSLAKNEGLKVKEIADLVQLSPKTIENQLTIAFKRLAAKFLSVKPRVIKMRS
jgi:RNA polymerase sigma-70 factor (ECF subfamily)